MVELEYVRRRKRKKIAVIVAAAASTGLAVLILVAFLGRFVGTFTVSLNTGDVKLTLSKNASFSDPTSYLKIDELPPFDLAKFSDLPDAEFIDSEETGWDYGTVTSSSGDSVMYFFKETFYVRNEGQVTAHYDLSVNITKNTPSADGRYLDTILRVMVYENPADSQEHAYTVYARKSEVPNLTDDPENPYTYKEYLSVPYDSHDPSSKAVFAEMFESDSVVTTLSTPRFESGDAKRYTIITWLEGYDQQAKGNPPEGGNIKLGVTINAYENNE